MRIAIVSVVLLAAACSEPAPSAPAPMADMAMEAPEAAGPIAGTGVVTALDAASGEVTIRHEAMPELSWPAMTMKFAATEPALLAGIAVGDSVRFELRGAAEPQVLTAIAKP